MQIQVWHGPRSGQRLRGRGQGEPKNSYNVCRGGRIGVGCSLGFSDCVQGVPTSVISTQTSVAPRASVDGVPKAEFARWSCHHPFVSYLLSDPPPSPVLIYPLSHCELDNTDLRMSPPCSKIGPKSLDWRVWFFCASYLWVCTSPGTPEDGDYGTYLPFLASLCTKLVGMFLVSDRRNCNY